MSEAHSPPAGAPAGTDPLLIDISQLARLLGVSKPTVERLKAAGKLPRHVIVSAGCHRWRRAEVEAWVRAGCPDAATWAALSNGL